MEGVWQGLMQESLMLFVGQLVQFGGLLAAQPENKQVISATVIVTQIGFTLNESDVNSIWFSANNCVKHLIGCEWKTAATGACCSCFAA